MELDPLQRQVETAADQLEALRRQIDASSDLAALLHEPLDRLSGAVREALRIGEERLRLLTDNIPQVFWIASDFGNRVDYVSPAYERVWGRSRQSLYDRPLSWIESIHPEDRGRAVARFEQYLRGGGEGVLTQEYRIVRPDGSVRWVEVRIYPTADARGDVFSVTGIAEDVTDRKLAEARLEEAHRELERRVEARTAELSRANALLRSEVAERERIERALRDSEARFRRLAEHAPDFIFRVERQPRRHYSYVSPAVADLVGYTPDELYADPDLIFRIVHPDDLEILMQALDGGVPREPILIRWRHRAGHTVWAEEHLVPIYDEAGEMVALEGIVRDVTERQRQAEEREMHAAEERALGRIGQALVTELELEGVARIVVEESRRIPGVDGVILYLADEAHRNPSLSYVAHDCVRCNATMPPALRALPLDEPVVAAVAARTRRPAIVEDLLADDAAARYPFESAIARQAGLRSALAMPLLDRGQLVGVVSFLSLAPGHFRTDTLQFHATVADLFAIAVEKARLHHDLRAHERQLNLLLRRTIDAQEEERQRICLDVHDGVAQTLTGALSYFQAADGHPGLPPALQAPIRRGTSLLEQAIGEVRDVVSSLRPATLDALGLVPTLRQELAELQVRAGIRIDLLADDVMLSEAVETGLYRIVREAMSNVVKHARASRVTLRLRDEGEDVVVTIQDDGAGFDLTRIASRLHPRGLGLISMRKRAELLGGSFTIESRPGGGTEVSVRVPQLPIDEPPDPPRPSVVAPGGEGSIGAEPVGVLIADDHPVAREGLRVVLEDDERFRVVGEAGDGAEAIEQVATLRPRVVLMDLRMPRVDGLEATRQIKALRPSVVVIAMTSYEDEALLLRAIQAGAAGYLLKGASRQLIRQTITAATGGGVVISASLCRQLMAGLSQTEGSRQPATPGGARAELAERERAVLELMAQGCTNREIASALGYAEITIKRAVRKVIAKLGASDRTQAVLAARRLGLAGEAPE